MYNFWAKTIHLLANLPEFSHPDTKTSRRLGWYVRPNRSSHRFFVFSLGKTVHRNICISVWIRLRNPSIENHWWICSDCRNNTAIFLYSCPSCFFLLGTILYYVPRRSHTKKVQYKNIVCIGHWIFLVHILQRTDPLSPNFAKHIASSRINADHHNIQSYCYNCYRCTHDL